MENQQLRSYLGLRDYTPLVSTEAARQNENCGTSARAGRAKSKLDKLGMLKGKEEDKRLKEYEFEEEDITPRFHMLLDKGLVELPDPRVPEEIGKVSDPKYCDFHRMVKHGTEKCYTFKKMVIDMIFVREFRFKNATSLPSRTETSNTMMLPPEQYASQQNERLQNVERRRRMK